MPVEPIRLPEMIRFAAEVGFRDAIGTAARQQHQNSSEFLRQTIRAALRERGVSADAAVGGAMGTVSVRVDRGGEP